MKKTTSRWLIVNSWNGAYSALVSLVFTAVFVEIYKTTVSLKVPPLVYYCLATGIIVTVAVDFGIRSFLAGRHVEDLPLASSLSATAHAPSQLRVLANNAEMCADIAKLLNQDPSSIQRVILVQYSGRNVRDTVKNIWSKTHADIELYLVDPSSAINKHQTQRIDLSLVEYRNRNEFDREPRSGGVLKIFTYEGPASHRIVLIPDKMLYIGAYFYMVMDVSRPKYDPVGGDMPLLAIASEHPEFRGWSHDIEKMLDNWKREKKTVAVDVILKPTP